MKKIFATGIALVLVTTSLQSVFADTSSQTSVGASFADFQTGQYWSSDMLWAINNGLISGYTNVKNSKTGKLENELKPYGTLTEGEALTILYRFFDPYQFSLKQPSGQWWATIPYQLAKDDGLQTKGSVTNQKGADTPITRGQLAVFIASKVIGKSVDQKAAIQFMYEAHISSGYTDSNGNAPKTFNSFGVNDILQRAQIVSMMKRLDGFLSPNTSSGFDETTSKSIYTKNGTILTYSGSDYGCNNQQEYDKVMSIIGNYATQVNSISSEDQNYPYIIEYLNGKRPYIPPNYTWTMNKSLGWENTELINAQNSIGDLVKAGVDQNTIIIAYETGQVYMQILQQTNTTVPNINSNDDSANVPDSAYDFLVNKLDGNLAKENVLSAFFNRMSFTTQWKFDPSKSSLNIGSTLCIEINDQWFTYEQGEFTKWSSN